MIKNLKKCLRNYYIKNPEGFWRGLKNSALVVFLLFCMFFLGLISGCSEKDSGNYKVYEVKMSGMSYQTSPENNRLKESVPEDITYLIVEGGVY